MFLKKTCTIEIAKLNHLNNLANLFPTGFTNEGYDIKEIKNKQINCHF